MIHVQYINSGNPELEFEGYTAPGWYFCGHEDDGCYGPFESQEKAQLEFDKYLEWLNKPYDVSLWQDAKATFSQG